MSNILITGGTGSLGLKLIGLLHKHNVVSISRNEFLISKARSIFSDVNFSIGDIRDSDGISKYFKNIDIVIHAAAIKHVDNGENFSFETLKTNIIGSQNIISLSEKYNIGENIFISSDKAAYVDNLYGSTKLTGERLFLASPVNSKIIRFGNLIGSNGSVFDLWKNSKTCINLTNEHMSRFFISKIEASRFIVDCIESNRINNKIIIPKIKSANMKDVADVFSKNLNLPIEISGIRPGEKIKEFLMTSEEFNSAAEYSDYWVLNFDSLNSKDINQIDSSLANRWDPQELFNMI